MKFILGVFCISLLFCDTYGSHGRSCHKSQTRVHEWHVYSFYCYVSESSQVWHAETCPYGSVNECRCLTGDPTVHIHSSVDGDGCNCWFRSSVSTHETFTMLVKCSGHDSCQSRINSAVNNYKQRCQRRINSAVSNNEQRCQRRINSAKNESEMNCKQRIESSDANFVNKLKEIVLAVIGIFAFSFLIFFVAKTVLWLRSRTDSSNSHDFSDTPLLQNNNSTE